jgi:osmoprotectant transport system ATP-binding protein
MISLQNVCKSFRSTAVVRDLCLEIGAGELVVLLGESGCGKTTTLKMINRLIEPSAGVITVAGRAVTECDPVQLRRSIGYVFQSIGLFPHMSVAENVGLVPRLLGWPAAAIHGRTAELLELVGLAELGARRPAQLSGGQRQRVGVARALAARPQILLMDEPFGALDPITRAGLQGEFLQIHRQLGLTTLMVTHDMMEALLLADRIAVMRDGAIEQLGAPAELLRRPRSPYVAELLRKPREQAETIDALLGRSIPPSEPAR